MTTQLNAQTLSVLTAIKSLAKPWSQNGGARLSEIADYVNLPASIVSLVLHKLVHGQFLVALSDEGKNKITRYYLNIYTPESRT